MRRLFAWGRGSDCRAESDGKIAVVGVDATREAVRAVEAALKAARANLSKNASTGARNW